MYIEHTGFQPPNQHKSVEAFQKVPTTFPKSRPLPCFSNMAGGYFLAFYGDIQNFAVILEGKSHIF